MPRRTRSLPFILAVHIVKPHKHLNKTHRSRARPETYGTAQVAGPSGNRQSRNTLLAYGTDAAKDTLRPAYRRQSGTETRIAH
jgi:hypothetical protein